MQQTGAELLRAWIKRMGMSQVEAVDFLGIPGIDGVVLNKILHGRRRPDLEKLILIEDKTGVPVKAWALSATSTTPDTTSTNAEPNIAEGR